MKNNNVTAIVLAAGAGKRMNSSIPKVLHKIAGEPMITRTLTMLDELNLASTIIVVSPKNADEIKENIGANVTYAIQKEQKGTADGVKSALLKDDSHASTVLILNGDDSAFLKPQTIQKILTQHARTKPKITMFTLINENSQGLGRIVRTQGKVIGIVEDKDATQEEKKIKEINTGVYAFNKQWLEQNLKIIKPSQQTGELYLTALIKHAIDTGQKVETIKLEDSNEWQSINTQEELEEANKKQEKIQSQVKRIHVMGIAGAGASAVAAIAHKYGFTVSGCDLNPQSPYAENLKNITVKEEHSREHVKNIDLLILSPAILKFDKENSEVKEAINNNISVISWQEFQGQFLQKNKFVITVAGAYGKSTTTAMISQILIDAKLDPTCEVGAKVKLWNTNFRIGKSNYYVAEADEYNENFLHYESDIAVILNIDWDHPDFFKSKEDVSISYKKFIDKIKQNGTLVVANYPALISLAGLARPDIKIVKVKDFGEINLSIIGSFRKENANAALTLANVLGIELKVAKKSIENFQGTGRRLEYKGKIKDTIFYDDYAVQPHTIKTTADALKEKFKDKKVLLVLEPHTFSRINTFFEKFTNSLEKTTVDDIFITDVYGAREQGDNSALAQKLAKAVGKSAQYTGSLAQTAALVKKNLGKYDVILSMGAGDSYKLYDLISK